MTWRQAAIFISLFIPLTIIAAAASAPPRHFPVNQTIEIPAGASVKRIADQLHEAGVILSPRLFRSLVARPGLGQSLRAGLYEFERPLSAYEMAERLRRGEYAAAPVKLTIPEGWSAEQVAVLVNELFPHLSAAAFLEAAEGFEGALFPDTYFLPPHLSAEQLVTQLRNNFTERLGELERQIADSGRTLGEVIKMASLVEEEAASAADRRLIAGILWKRFDADRRLEVDVEPATYETAGLPERPIVSPGLEAIQAVLEPTDSDYWFYLSDEDGTTHYAEDYEEHQQNIDKYLK